MSVRELGNGLGNPLGLPRVEFSTKQEQASLKYLASGYTLTTTGTLTSSTSFTPNTTLNGDLSISEDGLVAYFSAISGSIVTLYKLTMSSPYDASSEVSTVSEFALSGTTSQVDTIKPLPKAKGYVYLEYGTTTAKIRVFNDDTRTTYTEHIYELGDTVTDRLATGILIAYDYSCLYIKLSTSLFKKITFNILGDFSSGVVSTVTTSSSYVTPYSCFTEDGYALLYSYNLNGDSSLFARLSEPFRIEPGYVLSNGKSVYIGGTISTGSPCITTIGSTKVLILSNYPIGDTARMNYIEYFVSGAIND